MARIQVAQLDRSPIDPVLVRNLMNYALIQLDYPMSEKEIHIHVLIRKIHVAEDMTGQCNSNALITNTFGHVLTNSYSIQLHSEAGERPFIRTILHELRHIWQYETDSHGIRNPEEREKEWKDRLYEKDAIKWAEENLERTCIRLGKIRDNELNNLRKKLAKQALTIKQIKKELSIKENHEKERDSEIQRS